MGQIVADVAEDAAAEHHDCHIPVVEEDSMRELIEWCCKDDEKRGRHDKSVAVHGEIMVDAMEEEVEGQEDRTVG